MLSGLAPKPAGAGLARLAATPGHKLLGAGRLDARTEESPGFVRGQGTDAARARSEVKCPRMIRGRNILAPPGVYNPISNGASCAHTPIKTLPAGRVPTVHQGIRRHS